MFRNPNQILVLYAIIGLSQVTGIFLQFPMLHQSFKLLLMPTLAYFLWYKLDFSQIDILTKGAFLALFFSYLGDIILMIPGNSPLFFVGGLLSFLFAHIFYFRVFTNFISLKAGFLASNPKWGIPVALFLTIFLFYLVPKVGAILVIPIILYAGIICLMLLSTINTRGLVPNHTYNILVLGGLLFILSDSILAINKFDQSVGNSILLHGLVMITYISAQGLLVYGIKNITKSI